MFVTVPLISAGGSLVGMQYRPTDSTDSRFLTKIASGHSSALIGTPGFVPRDWVLVVEGATDWICAAQRLGTDRVIGIAGAGEALKTLRLLDLRQTRVYVGLDDDHAGNPSADACLQYLASHGITAYRVKYGGYKDACEYVAAGGDLLHAMSLAERDALLPVEDVMSVEPCAPRWLADGLFQQECCGVIGGSPKSYKTWFVLASAIALVTGLKLFDRFRVPTRGTRILMYSPEGSSAAISTRLHQLCASMEVPPSDLSGHVHRITQRIDFADGYHRVRETVRVLSPDVLIIDPLVSVAHVDENAAHELQPVLDRIRDLRQVQPNLAVWVVHHASKAGKDRAFGSLLRGSSCLHGWLDSLITVRMSDEEDPACIRRVDVQHREAPSPPAFGFSLRSDYRHEVSAELRGVQIAPCDAPELGRRRNSTAPPAENGAGEPSDLQDYYRRRGAHG